MKKLSDEHVTMLEDLLDLEGAEMDAYSGRGMFGRQCLGIDLDSMADAFRLALRIDSVSLAEALSNPKFDSMGLGIVIYWPEIEVPEGVGTTEDEDELG